MKGESFFKQKPPLHFHASQDEHFQVVEGKAILEYDGRSNVISKDSPPFIIRSGKSHRTYPLEPEAGGHVIKFLLSADKVPQKAFKLNTLFFENWYKYQEEVLLKNGTFNILQVLSVSLPLHPW